MIELTSEGPSFLIDRIFDGEPDSTSPENALDRECDVDVTEVRQLDAYLKKLFGNTKLRVVPQKKDVATIFVGDDEIGELTAEEDEGERSYNVRMVIQLGKDPSIQPVPALTAYLRARFENEKIRVTTRPKKTDSLEAYLGDEFLGVLFAEDEKGRKSYIFELPILDIDLVDQATII